MSEQPKKKNEPKVYRISESIFVIYEVVAASEKDALAMYSDLKPEQWQDLVADSVANAINDPDVVDEETYDHDEHDGLYPVSEKAKAWISKNIE